MSVNYVLGLKIHWRKKLILQVDIRSLLSCGEPLLLVLFQNRSKLPLGLDADLAVGENLHLRGLAALTNKGMEGCAIDATLLAYV